MVDHQKLLESAGIDKLTADPKCDEKIRKNDCPSNRDRKMGGRYTSLLRGYLWIY